MSTPVISDRAAAHKPRWHLKLLSALALAVSFLAVPIPVSADQPAVPTVASPVDGATAVATDAVLAVDVSHGSGEPVDVAFYGRQAGAGEPFTVVVMPDTQNYVDSDSTMAGLNAQRDWILAERDALDLDAVIQLGDIANYNQTALWTRAMSALRPLQMEEMAFAVMPGNHDYDSIQADNGGGAAAPRFDENFPVAPDAASLQRFGWAGGYMGDPNDAVTADQDGGFTNRLWKNNYVLFEAGGMDFIVISIEFNFPYETIQWLDAVLAEYPDHRAIINTHQWLEDDAGATISTNGPSGGAAAAWNAIKDRPNVFLVVSGHNWSTGGERSRVEQNDFGDDVYMHLSDYQGRTGGGNGWLRVLTFEPAADELTIETYSPSLDQYERDDDSEFVHPYDMESEAAPWQTIGSTTVSGGNGRASVTWTGLEPGTEYEWYAVVTHGGDSASNESAPWSFTTATDPGWTAYVATNASPGGSHANVLSLSGATGSGTLKRYSDGSEIEGVSVASAASSGVNAGTNGGNTAAGTDAGHEFGGIVNLAGVYAMGADGWTTQTYSGLDPNRTYTLTTTANRNGGSGYDGRTTTFELEGADDGFVNSSTAGSTANGASTTFSTGNNTTNGYVARWTGIDPGADGQIVLRSEHAGGDAAYAASAVKLVQEPTDAAPPLPGDVDWTAYVDTNSSGGGSHANVLSFSGASGSGTLKRYSDGSAITGAQVAISTSGTVQSVSNGANANAGTDADTEFGGIVDLAGVHNMSSGASMDMTFTGLDPSRTYTLVATANRGDASYTNRTTTFVLEGAEAGFVNMSSDGTTSDGATTTFSTGANSANGYVAKWTGINPGPDGQIVLASRYGTSGGTSYGAGAVKLATDFDPDAPPATPTGLAASATGPTSLRVTWNAVATATSYDLAVDGGTDDPVAGVTSPYTLSGMTTGVEVGVQVRAVNDNGASAWSPAVHATPMPPVESWDAYVDTNNTNSGTTGNVLILSSATGSGNLIRHTDGGSTGVEVTGTVSGTAQASDGANANADTDADEEFGGIVDLFGTYSIGSSASGSLTFTGLDSGRAYTLVATANRGNSSYESGSSRRTSTYVLQGAESYVAEHSDGVVETIDSGSGVRIVTGYNTATGHVARWTGIDPGSDGEIVLATQFGNTNNAAYLPGALRLTLEPSGGPGADTTPPVITLVGPAVIRVPVGGPFDDPGATALDDVDGDISGEIVVGGATVDVDAVGVYVITYDVSDEAGNPAARVTRRVEVFDPAAGWTAYVDTNDGDVSGDPTLANVVSMTPDDVLDGSAFTLRNFSDGSAIDGVAMVTTTSGATDSQDGSQGSTPTGGDANAVFGGIVNMADGYYITEDGSAEMQFTGLDPERTYTLVTSANRGNPDYGAGSETQRASTFRLAGADDFVAGHSAGVLGTSDGGAAVRIVTGDNTSAGHVARWTGIDPGDDGTVALQSIFDDAGTAAPASYLPDAILLALEPAAEPDTTAPVITLVGDAEVTIEVGSAYTDLGATALDDVDGDVSADIAVGGLPIATDAVGTYTVTYDVTDTAGNHATQVTRTVHVADTTAPIITRLGAATITIEVGSTYTDPGATATDNYDGNITTKIVKSGTVDTTKVATYTITYDVTDTAGNHATQVTRTVHVADTTAPIITRLGAATITIEVGSTYTDPGATATDNYDGNITTKIVKSGTVDTTKVATYTITYDVTDTAGNHATQVTRTVHVAESASLPPPVPAVIVPIQPARYWDTRDLPTVDGQYRNTGRVAAQSSYRIPIAGRGEVPVDAVAVIANLTVILPDAEGYATLYPTASEVPLSSTVNYLPGEVLANNVIMPLGKDGSASVFTLAEADFVLDVNGYVDPASPLAGIVPARYLDTRTASNTPTFDGASQGAGRVPAGGVVEVPIAGRGAVPPGAAAAIVNVTVVNPAAQGHLTMWSGTGDMPLASTVNFFGGQNVPNGAIVELSSSGTLSIFTLVETDLVLDVAGYIPAGVEGIEAATPARLFDSRVGEPLIDGTATGPRLGPGQRVEIQVTGRGPVPPGAKAAFLNVVAVLPDGPGHVTLFPCTPTVPETSNLNFATSGVVRANNAATLLSPDGKVCAYTHTGTDLVVDVIGWIE